MKSLKLQINKATVRDNPPLRSPRGGTICITPPIGEDFWMARVPLGQGQAVVCFPKFLTIGIGFQKETDWNTNLPYTSSAGEIYDHIKHNKGPRCKATRADCLFAIEMLQEFAAQRVGRPAPERPE